MDERRDAHGLLGQAPLVLQIVDTIVCPVIPGNGCPDVIIGEIVDRPEHLTLADFLLAPRNAFVSGFMLRDGNAPVQAFRHAHTHQHGTILRIGTVGREDVDKLMESVFRIHSRRCPKDFLCNKSQQHNGDARLCNDYACVHNWLTRL